MARLRAVAAKPSPAAPYRYAFQYAPYQHEDLARKWLAAIDWLRRGKKSLWILDNVAAPNWRDTFDDQGKVEA